MIEVEKVLERTSVSFEDLKDAIDKAGSVGREEAQAVPDTARRNETAEA
jgi:hypothetical protein